MGGGGHYYERDVADKLYRNRATGVTTGTERELSRRSIDNSFLPKGRRLVCAARNPLVYMFDVTGSMDNLPKIIYDKWPGIVGQVVARDYLPDPAMSISAVGDITSDSAPLQMADFSPLRNLDRYFQNIYFEGRGGGQHYESYEMAAYFYAYLCDMPNAENPICLITGDEGFREKLYDADLAEQFGGEHAETTATKVFRDLSAKFKGNALLIHRYYKPRLDAEILSDWRRVLGEDRVICLPQGDEGDLAIGDITLGVYAIVSGKRTLARYLEDMRTRPLDLGQDVKYEPQSAERIRLVEEALQPLKGFKPVTMKKTAAVPTKPVADPSGTEKPKKDDKSWKL